METTRLHAADRPPSGAITSAAPLVPADVDGYLSALRHEQLRFLSAVAAAACHLAEEHSELASAAAVHGRLARQFLDAQRSLLHRRAEVTAEVARIEREATANSSALVAMAHRRARAMSQHPAGQRMDRSKTADAIGRNGSLGERAAAAVAPIGVPSRDVAALVGEIDGVFETREAEGVVAQRQLAELLDHWWSAEQQEATAAIDDAHARAAVRQHVAVIEASSMAGEGHEADRSTSVGLLPSNITAVLELAVASDLDNVLTTLIASLQTPSTAEHDAASTHSQSPAAEVPLADGAILRFDTMPAAAADEAFQQFWAKQPVAPPPARRSRWWTAASVLVPITLLSSLVAVAATWVG